MEPVSISSENSEAGAEPVSVCVVDMRQFDIYKDASNALKYEFGIDGYADDIPISSYSYENFDEFCQVFHSQPNAGEDRIRVSKGWRKDEVDLLYLNVSLDTEYIEGANGEWVPLRNPRDMAAERAEYEARSQTCP